MSYKKIVSIAAGVVALIVFFAFSSSILETNIAGNVQVKQAAISGDMTCKLDPGMYGQWFGAIHTYLEADTFDYTGKEGSESQSLPIRFADATKASVSGTVRVLLPVTDCDAMVRIHRKFRSFDGLMSRLVEPAMRKSLFNTGPHMTAAESYAERRGEMSALAEDQLVNGVIRVDTKEFEEFDPLTGQKTMVSRAVPRKCGKENGTTCIGGLERELGVFREFNISLTNFVIGGIKYPDNVLAQIEAQRAARMDIITQQAEAKQAEARAMKAQAEAQAAVAETRAVEEIEKTQRIVRAEANKAEAILQAEQRKEVSKLDKEAAIFEKQKQILLGEGEATRKKLVMAADGALRQKLDTYAEVNNYWANAYAKRQVPHTVFSSGGGGGNGDSEVQDLVRLLTAKAAKDLALDFNVRGSK